MSDKAEGRVGIVVALQNAHVSHAAQQWESETARTLIWSKTAALSKVARPAPKSKSSLNDGV